MLGSPRFCEYRSAGGNCDVSHSLWFSEAQQVCKVRRVPVVEETPVGPRKEETRELGPLDVAAELQVVLAALLEEDRDVVANGPVIGVLEASAEAPPEGRRGKVLLSDRRW